MPRNNIGEIARTWMFVSSSGSGIYETIQYVSGNCSCNCPGWTRHVDTQGQRSCTHTRMVEQGVADRHAESSKTYAPVTGQQKQPEAWERPSPPKPRRVKPTPATLPPSRFKPTQPQAEPQPRSRFKKVEVPVDDDLVDGERFKRL